MCSRAAIVLGLALAVPPLAGFNSVSPPTADRAPAAATSSVATSSSPAVTAAQPLAAVDTVPRCAALVANMTPKQQVGQLFVLGVGSRKVSSSALRALRDHEVGGAVLLGNTTAGRAAVARVSAAVRGASTSPRGVRVLISADQEGGVVQRLQGPGFARIPSARTQAGYSDTRLRARARVWGTQLRAAGVTTNLAPVADVVPAGMERVNAPIGRLGRGFGPRPVVVAGKTRAVVLGMHDARVGTAVKHFPGLGRVRGNTDHVANVVDATTTRRDANLAGFKAGIGAKTDMVMVSSATYTRIDPTRMAVFSPVVMQGMLRGDLGYSGVIMSDDLGVAKAFAGVPVGARALRFFAAGGDLAINASPAAQAAMSRGVLTAMARDPRFAASVRAKATRVVSMKARQGLVACTG